MFPSSLQTGDSEAIQKDLLHNIAKKLVQKHHYRVIRLCRDRVGLHAYIMKDPFGQSFYLIVKGSNLWRGTISCQAHLPSQARNERRPIILAWFLNGVLKFYLFDPQEICDNSLGLNDRQGVRMENFKLSLGCRFEPQMNVAKVFKRKKYSKISAF